MPNEKPVCACGIVVDLPKSRSSSIVLEKLTILLPKSKSNKQENKDSRKQQDDRRKQLKTRTSSETGSSSLVTEPAKPTMMKNNKHEKRLNHSRRTRSADSAESHYTYIGQLVRILWNFIIISLEFFASHVYLMIATKWTDRQMRLCNKINIAMVIWYTSCHFL